MVIPLVNTTPLLPNGAVAAEVAALSRFDQDLIQALFRELSQHAISINALAGSGGAVRTVLSADTTFFVNGATGLDTNNGLSAAAPFKTIGQAIKTVYAVDGRTFNITIQIAAGTYAETIAFNEPVLTSGTIKVIGDPVTPANVTVLGFSVTNGASIQVSGLRCNGQIGIFASNFAAVSVIGLMRFANTVAQIQSTIFSNIVWSANLGANYTVEATATGFGFLASFFGSISFGPGNSGNWLAPVMNSVSFGQATMWATTYAQILYQGDITSGSSVTGPKFFVDVFSTINSANRGEAFFPGSTAGSKANGGLYL